MVVSSSRTMGLPVLSRLQSCSLERAIRSRHLGDNMVRCPAILVEESDLSAARSHSVRDVSSCINIICADHASRLSFYATFVYAAIIFSRHRKSSGYSEKLTGREIEEGSARFAPHRHVSGRTRPVSSVYEPFYQSTGHGRAVSNIYER